MASGYDIRNEGEYEQNIRKRRRNTSAELQTKGVEEILALMKKPKRASIDISTERTTKEPKQSLATENKTNSRETHVALQMLTQQSDIDPSPHTMRRPSQIPTMPLPIQAPMQGIS